MLQSKTYAEHQAALAVDQTMHVRSQSASKVVMRILKSYLLDEIIRCIYIITTMKANNIFKTRLMETVYYIVPVTLLW